MISIALYEPDIPQNVGAMMRLCACLGVNLDIIEPCGFPWNEQKIRQSGMDYLAQVNYTRHKSWQDFASTHEEKRVILTTTKANQSYLDFEYQPGDILLAGSESAGVPGHVHETAAARIMIPMRPGLRSLNIVNATSMILGEALRQTGGFISLPE